MPTRKWVKRCTRRQSMADALTVYLPWALSASTIYTMFLAGEKSRWTWVVALGSQAIWAIWIVASQTWGMIPGHLALWFVYTRNYFKWRESGQRGR